MFDDYTRVTTPILTEHFIVQVTVAGHALHVTIHARTVWPHTEMKSNQIIPGARAHNRDLGNAEAWRTCVAAVPPLVAERPHSDGPP